MLALALPLLAAAAPAAQDPVAFDIQCVIATETAMEGAKPEMKGMLMSAMTYFTGRVDAEIPSVSSKIVWWRRARRSRAIRLDRFCSNAASL